MARMRTPSRAIYWTVWVALAALGACQTAPVSDGVELLNSERIRLQFGSFGIEVLGADESLRVSSLNSLEGGSPVCRTFAVVAYPARIDPALQEAHVRIVDGASIGETFAELGWSIEKRHRYFGEIRSIESYPRVAGLMGLEVPADAAIHVYVFSASRDGRAIEYATITEVHHPDYLGLRELEALYGDVVGELSEPREELAPTITTVLRELAGS